MVMIEAMACGTAVVALRAGAVPEVVVDGVTGIVRDSPDDLARALHDVRAISPQACRDHVARNFSARSLAAGYEEVYRRVLADDRSARPGHALTAARRRWDESLMRQK